MQGFTPGPWIATEYNDMGGYDCMTGAIWIEQAGDPRRLSIATLDGGHYGQAHCHPIPAEGLTRMEANARLIAAAPELYAIVQQVAGEGRLLNTSEYDEARQLLARIRGEG